MPHTPSTVHKSIPSLSVFTTILHSSLGHLHTDAVHGLRSQAPHSAWAPALPPHARELHFSILLDVPAHVTSGSEVHWRLDDLMPPPHCTVPNIEGHVLVLLMRRGEREVETGGSQAATIGLLQTFSLFSHRCSTVNAPNNE